MNVLVIGSGGREHALAWKASQSSSVGTIFVAPGNAGTAMEPRLKNVVISVSDFSTLADFAQSNEVGWYCRLFSVARVSYLWPV